MFTPANRKELEDNGMTVVPNVISQEDCDRHQLYFRKWLSTFPFRQFPQSKNSLIQKYKSGHMQPAWETRLAAKPVFTQIWGTDKLLSSMDAIAIGQPPEESKEEFWDPGQSWLHVDQSADRKGLHAYQGAVYLETCEEDDWTFEVIEGSHKYFDDFMLRTGQWRCKNVEPHNIEWFERKRCKRMRVPCPKGGMILWDSRLFHANARPLRRRSNPGRWRFVVFVSMTPAWWASPSDLEKKRQAYEKLTLTTHWPSQEVHTFSPRLNKNEAEDVNPLRKLPEVGRSEEAQRLAGVLPYEEDGDGRRVPEFSPVWDKETWASAIKDFERQHDKRGFELKHAKRGGHDRTGRMNVKGYGDLFGRNVHS